MFKPKFKYTNKTVKLLTKISAAREVILNSPLIPKWNVTLRQEAIIHSAHSSTSIEGNRLSLEQVSELARGREITAGRRDKQEVLNYLDVLKNIKILIKNNFIIEKDILNIHRMVTKNTLNNLADSGVYRNRYVVVGNRFTGEVFFRPPQNQEVPGLVKDLLSWINSKESKEFDPIIEAGVVHYEFVRIHPFVDGNGRTARVLAALILYLRGFDTNQFFCLDDYYDSDRPAYYKALQSVKPDTLDLTNWLEYFTEGVNISTEAVKERIARLSSKRLRKAKGRQIALTERQMKIIEFINQNGKITVGDIAEIFKITRQAALKEIGKLIKLKVVALRGEKRGAHYILLK
jgi:Fic family protein